jgi:hypothetical protein
VVFVCTTLLSLPMCSFWLPPPDGPAECEQLLKRFLVLVPSRRSTLTDIMADVRLCVF